MWAQNAGIMKGYENGKFGASDDITREQLVTTLYRYTQYKGKNTKTSGDISGYPDASHVSKFANDAMKWAVGESIIKEDGGKLNPQGKASRATTATIFQRYETNPEFK